MKTYASRYADEHDKKFQRKDDENHVLKALRSYTKEEIQKKVEEFKNRPKRKKDPTGRAIYARVLAKMQVSQPQDAEEVQADKVAEGVVKEDTNHSKKALSEKTGNEISAKGEGDVPETSDAFDAKLQSTKGQGQKLDEKTKGELEQHTGTDLGGVNIHANSDAGKMSEDINAKAFTHVQDIYFKEGQYNPNSKDGKELLAHEVAHTVQQGEEKVQTKVQRQKLKDHLNDLNINDPVIRTTNEYKAYMNPGLVWQTELHLIPNEALAACKLILEDLRKGKTVNWEKSARGYALAARTQVNSNGIPDQNNSSQNQASNNTNQQTSTNSPTTSCVIKSSYKEPDVQKAAFDMVSNEKSIADTYLFLHKIRDEFVNYSDQIDELMKFFNPDKKIGIYLPDLKITDFQDSYATGQTPDQNHNSKSFHQTIQLNSVNSFTVAVATYLHEMNHYIDLYYHSKAAKKDIKNGIYRESESDYSKGVEPEESADLSKSEQILALTEYEEASLKQMLIDMTKNSMQPNEHPYVKELRSQYQDLINSPEYKGMGSNEQQDAITLFKTDARRNIISQIKGAYGRYFFDKRAGFKTHKGKMTSSRVELGFAFEKMAYGFYDAPKGKDLNWAENFYSNFETKYCNYLKP